MRTDIKFIGLGKKWGPEVAKGQANKLKEIGYLVRVMKLAENNFLIAYSHRSFTFAESLQAMTDLPVSGEV